MDRRLIKVLLTLVAALSLGACATGMGAGHDSPTQARFELRVSPTIWTSDAGKYEVRATGGYERALSNGGGNFVNVGGQMRMKTSQLQQTGRGLWLGAEAFYVRQLSSNGAQTTRHGVLVGLPLRELDYGMLHVYAGGGVSYWYGTGWYIRAGIELNPKR